MATLNIVNKSPFEKRSLEQCLARVNSGGSVLLIEDAVCAAIENNGYAARLTQAASAHKLYVLEPDLTARGLADKPLLPAFERVDYAGFVELVSTHELVHSWL